MKNKLIVANTYLYSTSDQFCFVSVTFYNNKAAYPFVNISYTFFISYSYIRRYF